MFRKIPQNYPLYDSVFGGDFPIDQCYVILFDVVPSVHENSQLYQFEYMDYLVKNGFELEAINRVPHRRKYEDDYEYLYANRNKQIFVKLFSAKGGTDEYKATYRYNIKKGHLTSQLNWTEVEKYFITKKKSNISLIKQEHGMLDTEEYEIKVPEMDLALNYGEKFLPIHETILKRLNTDQDKGIIMLHGDPGGGKTSYVKYLSGLIKNKEIMFIPPSMAEVLAEPGIIPFLMERKNSILVIEDGERVIADRETNGSASGVSNLLNLTDGILGDCLNIQIIVTFNMRREKIDQALLRKGRLIAEHKFSKLSVDETNKLLKHLGKDHVVTEGMVLTDIYNIDEAVFKTQAETKIGFNR